MQLQPFDRTDWMSFAGASGDDPKICWHSDGYIIVDAEGIFVGLGETTWHFECNQRMGEHIVTNTSAQQFTEAGLRDMGFERID